MASVLTSAGEGYDDVVPPTSLQERDGLSGRVQRFDTLRKFGFISISAAEGGGEVFFHIKEVAGGRAPREGDAVEFDTRLRGPEALRAVDVTRAGERARRRLALLVAEGKAAGGKRALASLSEGFSTGSASRQRLDAAVQLPAGLTSAVDLKRRQADLDAAGALAAAEDPEAARKDTGSRQSSEVDNVAAAQRLKSQALAASEQAAKVRKQKAKKKTRQAATLSFSLDDGE